MGRFNETLAIRITRGVSTMWCAYIFAGIALISLPAAIHTHQAIVIVAWVAQTFLQLVLLSIIMVGQEISSKEVAEKIDETHTAALAEFEIGKNQRAAHAEEMLAIRAVMDEIHELVRVVNLQQRPQG